MGISISAWFDTETEKKIRVIWQNLTEKGIPYEGHQRPRLTLAAYTTLQVKNCETVLIKVLENQTPLSIDFVALGQFLEPKGALFLSPVPSSELFTLREKILTALKPYSGSFFASYYEVDRWIPHCSLADGLSSAKLMEAFTVTSGIKLPIHALITRVGLIEFPKNEEICSVPFSAHGLGSKPLPT